MMDWMLEDARGLLMSSGMVCVMDWINNGSCKAPAKALTKGWM